MSPHLKQLLEAARLRPMSQKEIENQRINFAWGNAAGDDSRSTIDAVRAAAQYMKATQASK